MQPLPRVVSLYDQVLLVDSFLSHPGYPAWPTRELLADRSVYQGAWL